MNKIYKVIWSKVKHQYVVTSEFAHSCTKSTTSRVGKGALAALAAFVLTAGVGGVQAANQVVIGNDDNPENKDNFVLEYVAKNYLQTDNGNFKLYKDGGIQVGSGDTIFSVSNNGVVRDLTVVNNEDETFDVAATLTSQQDALDAYEAAGIEAGTVAPDATGSVAIGTGSAVESSHLNSAGVGSTGSVALGENAKARNRNTTAIGAGAIAWGDKSTALGNNARTAKDTVESVSVGYWAQAKADNSIALGSRSIADEANTVSVGNDNLKRRITNVDAGAGDFDAVNVKQMKDTVTAATVGAGMVTWDPGTTDTIHGVQLAGDGAISAASDRFSVDRYGNIAAQTYGGQGDNTNYYFNMNHADGISMGYSNGASINVDPNGVHFKVGEQETFINGNTMVTGRVNADTVQADTVQADAMYVGTQTPGNAVVTQDQLTGGISTATQGVVKWDAGTNDTIHGVQLSGDGAISAASDRFSVDRYGNIAAQTYGGEGDNTNYYFNMNHADGISMGYSNGTSMNIS